MNKPRESFKYCVDPFRIAGHPLRAPQHQRHESEQYAEMTNYRVLIPAKLQN